MAKCQATCPRDGNVIVPSADIVLDDEEGRYRFTCPKCKLPVDKPMDDGIRTILRGVGVPTVDELCTSFAGVLSDDRALHKWLLSLT